MDNALIFSLTQSDHIGLILFAFFTFSTSSWRARARVKLQPCSGSWRPPDHFGLNFCNVITHLPEQCFFVKLWTDFCKINFYNMKLNCICLRTISSRCMYSIKTTNTMRVSLTHLIVPFIKANQVQTTCEWLSLMVNVIGLAQSDHIKQLNCIRQWFSPVAPWNLFRCRQISKYPIKYFKQFSFLSFFTCKWAASINLPNS